MSAPVSELKPVGSTDQPAEEEERPVSDRPRSGRTRSIRVWVAAVIVAVSLLAATFLVFEFGLTALTAARAQRELVRDFQDDVVAGTQTVEDWVPAPGQAIGLLSIERLGVETAIIEGTTPDELERGVGHVRTTVLPGQIGNAALAGRRTTYGGPFGDLNELQQGDAIVVTTGQGRFVYTVARIGLVQPGQLDVLGSTDDPRLTLVTADPAYAPSGRLVVVAALQGTPLPAAAARPTTLEADELGTRGEPAALGPTLLWFELFLTTLVVVWLLRRRGFPGRVLWLLGLPIVVTLLWLSFENADRLLPGAL